VQCEWKVESFKSKTYLDLRGVPTIGWGTTKGIKLGMTITKDQAEAWIQREVAEVESAIMSLLQISCGENQLCALISLVYNIGISHFENSTLLRKLNAGDVIGASQEFVRWDHSAGREVFGLLNRRKTEQSLFLTPNDPPTT
jgi:lysozyme